MKNFKNITIEQLKLNLEEHINKYFKKEYIPIFLITFFKSKLNFLNK